MQQVIRGNIFDVSARSSYRIYFTIWSPGVQMISPEVHIKISTEAQGPCGF